MTFLNVAMEAAETGGDNANLIGGVALVVLFGLMIGLIAFGAGRDHS